MDNLKFDLITVGDSTIDTFLKIHDATVECDINHEECKICVSYGSKIPVDTISHGVAGGAANVAVASSLLGLKVAVYTNIGKDYQGKLIREAFVSAGIDVVYVNEEANLDSNSSVVLTFQGERTIFTYHQDWFYHLPNLDSCSWLYLTSLSETYTSTSIMDEIYHYLQKGKAKLVFAPGTYQIKADIKRYPKILEKCEIIIMNFSEAKIVLSIEPEEQIEMSDVLSKILGLGPKIAVITDGEEGSYASDGQQNLKVGIFPTKLVEKTGAGDAYASGLVAALHYSKPIEEAMIWGTINASHCIQEVGAQNGLLNREQLEKHRLEAQGLVTVRF